jgi:arsenate reductase
MAEGVLRHYGGDRFDVHSAGTLPCWVNSTAVLVMKEIGIDISGHRSKHYEEYLGQSFDYVITVCDNARETCPAFRAKGTVLHWSFPDPPHWQEETPGMIEGFRRVRDLIHERFKKAALEGFESIETP